MGLIKDIKVNILPYWRGIMVVVIPLALAPIPIVAGTVESRCGFVVLLMALYWMTEALPLAITSLLPVVLFPLLGVLGTNAVCMSYLKETVMMFMGSLMVALAIENCNLHRRISLRVLMLVGATPRWLMLGFMINTMFLSMWINNTAATAMMVPIVEAVVHELYKDEESGKANSLDDNVEFDGTNSTRKGSRGRTSVIILDDLKEKENENIAVNPTISKTILTEPDVAKKKSNDPRDIRKCMLLALAYSANLGGTGSVTGTGPNLAFKGIFRIMHGRGMMMCSGKEPDAFTIRKTMLLSVAYASNLGGTGTLVGSGPQLALQGIFEESYGSNTSFNFATWMAFNVPGMLICTFLAWIWLQVLFLGFREEKHDRTAEVKAMIRQKYAELGPIHFHEGATLTLFLILVALWFFREPQFIPGWADLFPAVAIDDATSAMFIVVIMFMLPAKLDFWWFRSKDDPSPPRSGPALLTWAFVQERMPWGIVLLLGGGFAMADACNKSGLSTWLGNQLVALDVLPPFAIIFVVCVMTAAVTEVASNTATANILLPVLAKMSEAIQVNPIYLMVPATVTCSYAFMLPAATPPNAIVFVAGKMKSSDMMKAGIVMNIVCVVVICILMEVLGGPIFDAKVYPDWASSTTMSPITTNAFVNTTCSPYSN